MTQRVFSHKCGNCRERAVALVSVPYTVQIDHDGQKYIVSIPALTVPRCAKCGTIAIDDEADEQINAVFRAQAGLLSPEEIREQRHALDLTQQALADLLGVTVATLARWETGEQIQQRSLDRFLRACFELAELRIFLAEHPQPEKNEVASGRNGVPSSTLPEGDAQGSQPVGVSSTN